MKAVRAIVSVLFVTFGLLAVVEVGFTVRSSLDRHFEATTRVEGRGKNRILVVSDSVFGMGREAIAGDLPQELENVRSNTYEIVNLSKPSNSSGAVNAVIDSVLDKKNPRLLVIMLGRSDLNKSYHPDVRASYLPYFYDRLSKLRITRLYWQLQERLQASADRIQAYVDYFTGPRAETAAAPPDPVLSFYRHKNFVQMWELLKPMDPDREQPDQTRRCLVKVQKFSAAEALKLPRLDEYMAAAYACAKQVFVSSASLDAKSGIYLWLADTLENIHKKDLVYSLLQDLMTLDPKDAKPYFMMGWDALSEHDCKQTIHFFEEALRRDPEERRVLHYLHLCYITTQRWDEGAQFLYSLIPQAKDSPAIIKAYADDLHDRTLSNPQAQIPNSDERLAPPRSADHFAASLWVHRRLGHTAQVNELFANASEFVDLNEDHMDEFSYREIVRKALDRHIPVLALQYPSDPDWIVRHAIHPFEKGVYFLSLKEVLLTAVPESSIADDFDDDFLHLTARGSRIEARQIASKIDEIFSGGQNEL